MLVYNKHLLFNVHGMNIKVVVKYYYERCSLLSCSSVSLSNPFYIDKIIFSATATCLACVRNTRARVIDHTVNGQKNTRFCVGLYDMIYLLTAIGLSPGGSSTVHIYTQTIHRTTLNKQYIEQHNNLGECGPCPVLVRFTLAFALQLRKKHGKILSVNI